MTKPKGGRGNRALYETVVVRVPKPVLETIDEICEAYRSGEVSPEQSPTKPVTSFDSIKDEVNEWRRSTKVGKDKLKNLLQLIYGGVEIDL